jgi:hypothetical protein
MKLRNIILSSIVSAAIPLSAFGASLPEDNPSPCQVTTDATIEATISTAEADGELWEYKGHSGGNAKLTIRYLLSPMGDMSGSFLLDPGGIQYALCVAEAANFYSLPPTLGPKSHAVPLHAPHLRIKITRDGSVKTVDLDDPADSSTQEDVARFLRVWNRIWIALPLRPAWPRASNQRLERP